MTLEKINTLTPRDTVTFFRQCCGSLRWAREMEARRPFADVPQLFSVAENVWNGLTDNDWKEAFSHHPKIGDIKDLRKKFPSTAQWAEGEQAGVQLSAEKVLKALAEGNNLYEAKFGYIFIVCATGKSASEMLALLNKRLNNVPHEEIIIAAGEQAKITKLRLEKLLS
jgi:2-oxo-4-hydroxy-4-carboxy-5-ureidoimidazoline decarboxylase